LEENLIVVGVKDDAFTPKAFAAWTKLMSELKAQKEVDLIISISDLKKLQKNLLKLLRLVPFVDQSQTVNKAYLILSKRFVQKHAFYEGLLFNKKNGTILSHLIKKNRQHSAPSKFYSQ
jgi:hypothetical protein